ncbi:CHAP domain-containing protein [Staphylococcus pettenkoferi]|nr:CHAP domain-containing protein [Staphylococcus pettenkoferi]MDK7115202.1 CHAP domain-containing protein [Staphylococcus pettenkoferi]MDK7283156.1 CHAP domain-containing protein [Staphylococcus pettenkoferi]
MTKTFKLLSTIPLMLLSISLISPICFSDELYSNNNEQPQNSDSNKKDDSLPHALRNQNNEIDSQTSSPRQTNDFTFRNSKGFVDTIDLDTIHHNLLIDDFNNTAKDEQGHPLAMNNGKIIEHPQLSNNANLYTPGQCTYYVFDKRAQIGRPISTFWGDAKYWAQMAANEGFKVDHIPSVGAILQTTEGASGHVAFVETINIDGSIRITEMNFLGVYIVSSRTIPTYSVSNYKYIH